MLNPEERAGLRQRALRSWAQSTETVALARAISADAVRTQEVSVVLRSMARSIREEVIDRVSGVLEAPVPSAEGPEPGVGLVTAGRLQHVGELHHALSQRLPNVHSARDPALAVGLAILTQPDIALVADDVLPLISGLDTACLIRWCAPEAAVVLFTSDPETDDRARHDGILTSQPLTSADALLATIDELVA